MPENIPKRPMKWEEAQFLAKHGPGHHVNVDNDIHFIGVLSCQILIVLICILAGLFVAHSECCAPVGGYCQTFSIHIAAPGDPTFVPLLYPRPELLKKSAKNAKNTEEDSMPSYYCKVCHTSPESNNAINHGLVRKSAVQNLDMVAGSRDS